MRAAIGPGLGQGEHPRSIGRLRAHPSGIVWTRAVAEPGHPSPVLTVAVMVAVGATLTLAPVKRGRKVYHNIDSECVVQRTCIGQCMVKDEGQSSAHSSSADQKIDTPIRLLRCVMRSMI